MVVDLKMPLLFEFPITLTRQHQTLPQAYSMSYYTRLMIRFITEQYYLTLGFVSIVFLAVVTEQEDNRKIKVHIIPPLSRPMKPELSTGGRAPSETIMAKTVQDLKN